MEFETLSVDLFTESVFDLRPCSRDCPDSEKTLLLYQVSEHEFCLDCGDGVYIKVSKRGAT